VWGGDGCYMVGAGCYMVGAGCSSLLFLVLSWFVFRRFHNPLLVVTWNIKIRSLPCELYTLCSMACCS